MLLIAHALDSFVCADADGALLARFCVRCDYTAFADLVARYQTMVQRVCGRVLRSWQDVEAASQNTFRVLMHKAAELCSCASIAGWLKDTARLEALNIRRSNERRRILQQQAAKPCTAPGVAAPLRMERKELAALVHAAVEALPQKYREVIALFDLQEKSRSEVAQLLGIAEGTVASRAARGREQMKRWLEDRGITAEDVD